MSDAVSGIGAVFRRLIDSVYEDLAEVVNISGPNMSRNMIEVTHLGSSGGYQEFIAGLRDPGTVDLTLNFTRATYEILKADFESDSPGEYEIILPDIENTSLNFVGFITELPIDVLVSDRITCNVSIRVSGQVNLNSGSGSA